MKRVAVIMLFCILILTASVANAAKQTKIIVHDVGNEVRGVLINLSDATQRECVRQGRNWILNDGGRYVINDIRGITLVFRNGTRLFVARASLNIGAEDNGTLNIIIRSIPSPTSPPTPTLRPTPTIRPTPTPVPSPTAKPTIRPTSKPTIRPTPTPVITPTTAPTPTPTPKPAPVPSVTGSFPPEPPVSGGGTNVLIGTALAISGIALSALIFKLRKD